MGVCICTLVLEVRPQAEWRGDLERLSLDLLLKANLNSVWLSMARGGAACARARVCVCVCGQSKANNTGLAASYRVSRTKSHFGCKRRKQTN